MDPAALPSSDDHCRITILVRPIGTRVPTIFNRIQERLGRQRVLLVSDSPRRVIQAHFAPAINAELTKFGELQAHRRIFGVIGIACSAAAGGLTAGGIEERRGTTDSLPSTSDGVVNSSSSRRLPPLTGDNAISQLEEIHAAYKTIKAEHAGTLVDSRCILIGFDEDATRRVFSTRETLAFRSLDESEDLEHGIRDLLRAIYTVLESRRVDGNLTSGKAIDSAIPCPLLPEEEKFRVGVENKESKGYRRKVAGRLKKQVADLCLLSGLPREALDGYAGAIELLKSASDQLWLAGALEGWAVAAMAARAADGPLAETPSINGLHRVSSMTPEQIRHASGEGWEKENGEPVSGVAAMMNGDAHLSAPPAYLGHHRYRSDEGAKINLAGAPAARPSPAISMNSLPGPSNDGALKKTKMPWAALRRERRGDIDSDEIVDKIEQALENYARFSFAAVIEYECMMKAVEVYLKERQYILMEQLHRERVGKYLDDTYNRFDHLSKAAVCAHSALFYKKIGFRRKHAFFSRLGVLFRLHLEESSNRTIADYRLIYPTLYRTLAGYGIPERVDPSSSSTLCSESVASGPIQLQIKALHEVFTSAMRAQYSEAAIRHACYLLQVYYDAMDAPMVSRLFIDLEQLVQKRRASPSPSPSSSSSTIASTANSSTAVRHHLGQLLSLECGIILPPLQMTRFPMLSDPALCQLPARLAPRVLPATTKEDIFIYSPFQRREEDSVPSWVVGCPCSLSVLVYNCRPSELVVHELVLISEGVAFDAVPVKLALPPAGDGSAPTRIRLIGTPRSPGLLTLTGYSCEVFGVRNVCRLPTASGKPLQVQVLPALPLLTFDTTLPRAPVSEEAEESVAELRIYSGQTFEHVITVVNSSTSIGVRNVRLGVQQPKVTGGPSLVEVLSMDDGKEEKKEEEAGGEDQGAGAVRMRKVEDGSKESPFALSPKEERRIRLRIFGIDPTATAEDADRGEDERAESARQSMATVSLGGDSISMAAASIGGGGGEEHDLIPYTGRLLVVDFVFTYEADMVGEAGERFSRRGRFRLLISIVPAISVSSWSVLPGDGPFSRYIVVDVSNGSEADAELVYSGTKAISVQPRETCRVPLLSACCMEVGGRAFHAASQIDSMLMQRMEVERLRRRLEEHVAKHLDIRWSIPSMQLSGLVPVGALLSSVALLKQLVLPAISLSVAVNGSTDALFAEQDVVVGIGEMIEMRIDVVSSLDHSCSGILSLSCYQEISTKLPPVDRAGAITITSARRVPFNVERNPALSTSLPSSGASATFHLLFRAEGQYKLRPLLEQAESAAALGPRARRSAPLAVDEIFVTPLTFNVTTKGVR